MKIHFLRQGQGETAGEKQNWERHWPMLLTSLSTLDAMSVLLGAQKY